MSNGKKTTPKLTLNIASNPAVNVFGVLTDGGFTVFDATDDYAIASGYQRLAASNLPVEQQTKGFVLKPETVVRIVRSVPGNAKDNTDVQTNRVLALIAENGVQQNTPASMSAQTGDPEMIALAAMVPQDDPIFKHVDMALDGKKDWEGAPLVCAMDWKRLYGRIINPDGTVQRPSSLHQFAWYGSDEASYSKEELDASKLSNEKIHTDIYYTENDTTGKPIKHSRLEDWWINMPKGRMQKLRLLQAQAIVEGKELPDTPADLLRNKDKKQAAAQAVKDARSDLSSSLNRLGKGLNFCHVADRIAETFPNVTWRFSRADQRVDDNGKITSTGIAWDCTEQEIIDSSRSTVPICMLSNRVGADNPPASALNGFLNLRVNTAETTEKVARLGGAQVVLADLLPKRAPRKTAEEKRALEAAKLVGTADKEGLGIPQLPNNSQAQSMMWSLCNFFDKSENVAAIYLALDPKKNDSNELVLTIGELQRHVANIYSKVSDRYLALTMPKKQDGVVVKS